jgi:CheY-like chemotaxis protein
MAGEGGATVDTSEIDDLFLGIETSCTVMKAVLDDSLDFCKLDAGRMSLETVPFELARVLSTVSRSFSGRAAENQTSLSVHVDDELSDSKNAVVLGDPIRLAQVITNLVSNAIKFTAGGHVSVSAKLVSQQKEQSSDGRVWVQIRVKDNGIGISKEAMPLLFKPFSQAHVSTARRYGGTGLGLSIVRRILDIMDGDVEHDSVEGRGTTAKVLIPFLLQHGAEPAALAAAARPRPQLPRFASSHSSIASSAPGTGGADGLAAADHVAISVRGVCERHTKTFPEQKTAPSSGDASERDVELAPLLTSEPSAAPDEETSPRASTLSSSRAEQDAADSWSVPGSSGPSTPAYFGSPPSADNRHLRAALGASGDRLSPRVQGGGGDGDGDGDGDGVSRSDNNSGAGDCSGSESASGSSGRGGARDVSAAAAPVGASGAADVRASPDPQPTLTILVVDDDPLVLKVNRYIMGRAGCSVLAASSGEKAIDMFRDENLHFDAVMCDLMMPPGIGGLETMRALRGLGFRGPSIACTGGSGSVSADRESTRDAGFDDIIFKPVDRDLVLKKLDWVCSATGTKLKAGGSTKRKP